MRLKRPKNVYRVYIYKMSIHENLENLPESKEPEKSVDNIEIVMEPLDEKVENNGGIHANRNRRPFNNRLYIMARRNIMANALYHNKNINNNNKKCLKSMIKAGKKQSYHEDINKKIDRLRRTTELYKMGKPQQKSLGLPNPVKSNELYKHQQNNLNLWQASNGHSIPLNATEYIEFKMNESVKKEEPKQTINLSEIVSKVLCDVVSKNITTIEDVIGKLRLSYEENSKFTNANKKYISWLNFEDDTCKPVLQISEEHMKIIDSWYNECNLILDVEKTDVSIPESIPVNDLSGVLFNEINCKYKDEYVNKYLPLVINNLISSYSIKTFEKSYFTKNGPNVVSGNYYGIINQYSKIPSSSMVDYRQIYKDLGIIIPNNLSDLPPEPEVIAISSGLPTAIGTYKTSNPGLRSEPVFITNPYLPNTNTSHNSYPYTSQESIPTPIDSYDSIKFVTEKPLTDNEAKTKYIYHSYNEDYNVLNPGFAQNALSTVPLIIADEIKKTHFSLTVILNSKFLQTLCILNPTKDELNVLNNNTEYGFIKLFSINTLSNDAVKFISNEFNKAQFDNVDELNQKLQVASQYIDFSLKHSSETDAITEESIVKKFIQSSYTIDTDINNKMKASVLHDAIVNSKVVTIEKSRLNGFKNRLSTYLKNLGLEKKRYNDGYYYYGIQPKKSTNSNLERTNISYDEYILERNKPFEYNVTELDYCTSFFLKKPMDVFKECFEKLKDENKSSSSLVFK